MVRNKVMSGGFTKVGEMHICKKEIPDEIISSIGDIGGNNWVELELQVSGTMIPNETQAGVNYQYSEDNPDVIGVSLCVIRMRPNGTEDIARTHSYPVNQFEDFVGDIEDEVRDSIELSSVGPGNENNVSTDKSFR
jgi:hypothetical protein